MNRQHIRALYFESQIGNAWRRHLRKQLPSSLPGPAWIGQRLRARSRTEYTGASHV